MPGNLHPLPPAEVLAAWPTPNYVDPEHTRDWMPAFAMVWQVASTILVAARFYLRAKRMAGGFGMDDLFIFFGWIFSVGFTVSAWIGCQDFELSRHAWDVKPNLYEGAAMVGWIAQVLFILSTCPTKLSVLLFYRRMIKDTLDLRWIWAIWIALIITGGYGLAVLLACCLMCTPLDAYWKSYDFSWQGEYHCIDGNALTITTGFFSVLSDLAAVIIPWLILRHYELAAPKRQKIALNIIFSLGLLVAGAGVGRTYYLWAINHSYDTSWTGFNLFAWSMVECQLGMICACAPSLRAFFRHYFRENNLRRTLGSGGSSVSHHPHSPEPKDTYDFDVTCGSSERTLNRTLVCDVEKGGRIREVDLALERAATEKSAEVKTTTADEYEMYAVGRLERHVNRATSVRMSKATEVDLPSGEKRSTIT